MSPATENLSPLLRQAQQWQLGRAGNRDNQMEGSRQGLFFTHDSWALLFPQGLLETFLWPWHKESTEQICDLAQESVHGSGRDTCNLKKHIQADSMILYLVKNPAVLWKVDLVVRGGGKKKPGW